MGFIPLESAEECRKAMVKRACRGDMYVREPSWVKILFTWKLFCPQVVDWANLLAIRISQQKPHQHLELKAE